jgi:hypothetical protein
LVGSDDGGSLSYPADSASLSRATPTNFNDFFSPDTYRVLHPRRVVRNLHRSTLKCSQNRFEPLQPYDNPDSRRGSRHAQTDSLRIKSAFQGAAHRQMLLLREKANAVRPRYGGVG